MPTYDYRCDSNDRVVEANHRMSAELSTWGELCQVVGIEPGDTPTDAPVRRLATGGHVISHKSLGSGNAPACGTGACGAGFSSGGGGCGGGYCGLN
ncbi:MAG: zinc ribbon domain-containing protein [Pseudomonadota bacterium]